MRRSHMVAELHDISVPIHTGMHVYDGNPGFRLELVDSIAAGAHANVSRLDLGVHKRNARRRAARAILRSA